MNEEYQKICQEYERQIAQLKEQLDTKDARINHLKSLLEKIHDLSL